LPVSGWSGTAWRHRPATSRDGCGSGGTPERRRNPGRGCGMK
jgi:hypothetical protein